MSRRTPHAAGVPPWRHALVFATGAGVLALEILGTYVISPVFGSTVYVWSALITVTLAALAAGYAAGGSLADRREPRGTLAAVLAVAGGWLLLVPLARRHVLLAASGLGVQAGALAGAALLFAVPLACLGAVGPLCIRLGARELDRVGREVGAVTAVSTVGSVAGALATAYWIIPRVPIGAALYSLAASVLALAALCAVAARRRDLQGLSAALLLAALAGTAAQAHPAAERLPDGSAILERRRSFYGDVLVMDRPRWGKRVLYIDGIANTVADLKTLESTSDYISSFEILPFLRPGSAKALMIGLGGGVLSGRLWRHYGIASDAVDVDPSVVRLARRYFGYEPTGEVFLEDGRRFLERTERAYDFIALDAFSGDHHPYHLFSVEALGSAAARLRPGGVLAVNLIGYAVGPRAGLRRAFEATLREVFPHVRVLGANRELDPRRDYVNMTFFASTEPLELPSELYGARPELAEYYRGVHGNLLPPEKGGKVITDELNPVESLSAPAFAAVRRQILRINREALSL